MSDTLLIFPSHFVDCDDFSAAYSRILATTQATAQAGLAAILHVRQSTVSDAHRRQQIPANWLLTLREAWQTSPLWILHGIAPQKAEIASPCA